MLITIDPQGFIIFASSTEQEAKTKLIERARHKRGEPSPHFSPSLPNTEEMEKRGEEKHLSKK